MPSFFRSAIVVVLTAVALAASVPDIFANWYPWGTYGYSARIDGTITAVFPDTSASKAGIRAGDLVALGGTRRDVLETLGPFSISRPGSEIDVSIQNARGERRTVRLVSTPWPRSFLDNVTNVIVAIVSAFGILIPAWLVLTRPSWATWSFFLFATFSGYTSAENLAFLPNWMYPWLGGLAGLQCIGAWSLAVFAAMFPSERMTRRRGIGLSILALSALAVAVLNAFAMAAIGTSREGAAALTGFAFRIEGSYALLMYVLACAIFAIRYLRADAGSKARLRWVALGFIAAFGGSIFVLNYPSIPGVSISIPVSLINVFSSLSILAPLSVAYAIAKHRVIDVRFVLSRALVYGVLTTLAVTVLALLEYVVAHQLEETRLGGVVEVAGAVAIGFGIQRAHRAIDELVDRYVFRTIHDAERHFATIGRAMMFAESPRGIDELLIEEALRAFHLTGGAVYHPNDRGYVRAHASGYDFEDVLDHDHATALHLLAEHTPIERDGELAVPLTLRDRLLGFALFGHHTNGTAIDPAERDLLASLCHRAAVAYDHVISEERASEIDRLRIENGVLRSLVVRLPEEA